LIYIAVVLFAFITTTYVIFRDPWVQTLGVRIVSHYFSVQLHTEIKIGGFDLSLRRGLTIDDITIKDRHQSELFKAHKLSIIPGKFSLSKRILNLKRVYIDKGIIQLLTHRGDTDINLKFIIDYFSSPSAKKPSDTIKSPPWHFSVGAVELASTRFRFQDENKPLTQSGINYANIDVSNINLLLTGFHPDGDTMKGRIIRLSATERSGFMIRSMSGDFQVSPVFLKAHNLKLITNNSNIDLSFDFLYDHWDAYNDFLNKVKIKASINPTILDLEDIGAFAPVLYVMKDKFKLEGKIRGTVNNFSAKDFRFAYGTVTRFIGNIHATGLPNVEETFVDMNIKEFVTNREDIRSFNLPITDKNLDIPAFLKNAGNYNLKGNFTGFYNDFVANASLHTAIGDLRTDLTLKKEKGVKGLLYTGEADVSRLQLDQLFKTKDKTKNLLGTITLRADLNGRGFDPKDAIVTMNVWIDSLGLNNYTYQHITLNGRFEDQEFNGRMNVDDANLKLDFNGLINLADSLPSFHFGLQLNYSQLFKLNLLKRDSVDAFSAIARVDIKGSNIDNIEGSLSIDSSRYTEGKHTVRMKHLSLITLRDQKNNKSYHLLSDFVDADISGNFYFSSLIPSLSTFITNYIASFELNDSLINHHPSTNQQIDYNVRLKKTDPVLQVFLPALRFAPNTNFKGSYNENEGMISLNGSSPELTYKAYHFTDWFIKATTRQDNLNIQTGCGLFFVSKGKKKDSAIVMMDSLHLVSNLHHDSILYDIYWNSGKIQSDMGGFVNFKNSPVTQIKLTRFHSFIDKHYWSIANDNEILIDSSRVILHDLAFQTGEQKLKVDGTISNRPTDTLLLQFNKVDISDVDLLLSNPNVDVDGILSGKLKLMSIPHSMTVLSNLTIEKFTFNKELLGDLGLNIFYDENVNRFDVDSHILYTGNAGTNIPLSLKGSYYLTKLHPHLDFNLSLKNLNLKMVSPFVSSFMSRLNGLVSGEVKITGSPERPVLAGKLNLMRSEFKINYLNVPYTVVDAVTVDSVAFNFNHLTVLDSLGNKAFVNGKIYHNFLQRLELDLSIEPEDFSVFRNTYAQNNIFYGTARGTGDVTITGPVDNIRINARAKSGGSTHVYIPISSAADIGQNDYIIFTKPVNDSIQNNTLFPTATPKGLSLGLAILVNPTADVEVSLPNQLGNIKANGSGNLTMDMTPTTGFSLSGSYTIQKGSFHFIMKSLGSLSFSIEDGSRISWSGDPANANVNISALYKTRVPLGDLGGDEDKYTRIPVECIIRLSGQLSNPDISFGLNLPNADEKVKQMVFPYIDTSNSAEMTQQILSILVFGQFKSNKGTSLASLDVGSTSLSLIMSQFNSLISKVSKNVDIGVNYRRSSIIPGQEFDVAVSTQLFNERLLIDGLFGVNSLNPNTTVQKVSTIVGDINLQYILTNNRRWRARVFNRTNTLLIDNNAPYTQGIGLSYTRDFNNWGDFFKSDKSKTNK
jgi:hypothetical protein